jgi:hypothetical protein
MVSCNSAKSRPSKRPTVTRWCLRRLGGVLGGRVRPKGWGWCLGMVGYLSLSTLQAGMTIQLTLGGDGLTLSQADAFQSAKRFWEERLVGYQPGITLSGVNISGSSSFIDGLGGTVGEAAPQVTTVQAGYTLAVSGTMSFDTADLAFLEANNVLHQVLRHEMAHVLGFGILWPQNSLYIPGSGRYLGALGLAAYRSEFLGQSAASFVPVERGGGTSTADFHWDEVDFGAGLTGRVTTYGRDMRDELMSGWLNRALPAFVSRTTLGQFEDLGFVANYAAVPEPHGGLLWLASLWMFFSRRRGLR